MSGGVSEAWRRDHPWAVVYRRFRNSPLVAWPAGHLVFGLDLNELEKPLALIDEVPDGGAVLDAPCGPGPALRGLRPERRLRYVAADISPKMLARTAEEAERRGLTQVEALEADVGDLPFADREFDLCLSLLGLHVVPEPARAVSELARVLKPGGKLAGTMFVMDSGPRYWVGWTTWQPGSPTPASSRRKASAWARSRASGRASPASARASAGTRGPWRALRQRARAPRSALRAAPGRRPRPASSSPGSRPAPRRRRPRSPQRCRGSP